ncbi:hypothetical protein AB0K60_14555 [Thermopolyspora sp. NPDC052614]|uniref:hypothetical protein n=1 Tax=Thermopolyspora sp. NPDC052614 TaxID=3155682 RepID=UPI00342CF3DB
MRHDRAAQLGGTASRSAKKHLLSGGACLSTTGQAIFVSGGPSVRQPRPDQIVASDAVE